MKKAKKAKKVEKHLPSTWAKKIGVRIMDPDGWRNDGKSLNVPLTKKEFDQRIVISTVCGLMDA